MKTRGQVLGQNFLHHKPTIEKILALVDQSIEENKPRALLEIGPGKLALTKGLAERAQKHQLPLILVERDRALEADLRDQNHELHMMDAASDRFAELLQNLKLQARTPILLVSNLPYSAASQILAQVCHQSALFCEAIVMVQKEMALRMAAPANSKERGSFSLFIQSYFKPQISFHVGGGAFHPAPKVESTVLRLIPATSIEFKNQDEALKFEHFCKMLFSQRRKMIRKILPIEKHSAFPNLGLDGTERPETLDLQTVFKLFTC